MPVNAASLLAGEQLRACRNALGLSIREFAKRAGLPYSLIAGLETGHRRIGEKSARKIITTLKLKDGEADYLLSHFLRLTKQRVLQKTREYPPEVVNILAQKLWEADISPESIVATSRPPTGRSPADLVLTLKNGKQCEVQIKFRSE